MDVKKIIKDTFVLVSITIVLALLLSVTKVMTNSQIKKMEAEKKFEAYSAVCPGYAYGENIVSDVVGASAGYNASLDGDEAVKRCKDESGNIIGYIVECSSKGYGGPINIIVGFNKTGNITGIRFAKTPSETPGLGMKVTEQSYLDKWININHSNVSEVDAISGATKSSNAFKEAVSLACMFASRAVTLDGGI